MIDIAAIAASRHSCKAFDPQKKIPQELFDQLCEVLRLSPSSVNSQPWHFFVASDAAGKQALAGAASGVYSYNAPKLLACSHAIAICVRRGMDTEWLDTLLAQEVTDGRFANEDAAAKQRDTRRYYVDLHRDEWRDTQSWLERQVYLALGALLYSAAAVGVDACPIEGFDAPSLDEALGLREKGLRAVVLVALGYRSESDFNAALPKSRVPAPKVFTSL